LTNLLDINTLPIILKCNYNICPGLSTADQVTQISGRGVGLDVVQSDIKALGGHVSVKPDINAF
jgi:hypothetical protein